MLPLLYCTLFCVTIAVAQELPAQGRPLAAQDLLVYERFENTRGNFRICPRAPDVSGLKILLVDDVITTGSTLEACCRELLEAFPCQLYVATVSWA